MTLRWPWVRELPGVARWVGLAVLGALLLAVVGFGAWTWHERRERAAHDALGAATTTAQRAAASGEPAALEDAARQLRQFVGTHGGSRAAAIAWYLLGDIEFRRGQWDAAAGAFTEAARRDPGSVGRLSRLGQGYALEAKGDFARALEAYQQGLVGLTPKDFLYGDLLLAKARVQEQSKDGRAAIATYQQYLKELPTSDRVEEVRLRLGFLGATT